jgi:hypothetical protein
MPMIVSFCLPMGVKLVKALAIVHVLCKADIGGSA